jgi:hypothetical protein
LKDLMMNPLRSSVAGWLIATAIFALLLAPLAYLTDAGNLVLMYLKFSLMTCATFLARFGENRHRSWWFGFSAVGWASILFNVPGLWNANSVNLVPGLDLTNLSGSIASQLPVGSTRIVQYNKLTAVVETWLNLLAAVGGGMLALALDRRGRRSRDRAFNRIHTR